MPYIDGGRRDQLERPDSPHLLGQRCAAEGELNYVLTRVCLGYLFRHGKKYATMNAILGVLAAMSLEFYRRVAADYEDEKIATNGDVYPG